MVVTTLALLHLEGTAGLLGAEAQALKRLGGVQRRGVLPGHDGWLLTAAAAAPRRVLRWIAEGASRDVPAVATAIVRHEGAEGAAASAAPATRPATS